MSYIDRDKISLPEIQGHMCDHHVCTESTLLHWLFPRKDLSNGLCVSVDDKVCLEMANCIMEVGVDDIYVEEAPRYDEGSDENCNNGDASDFEDELGDLNVEDDEDAEVPELPLAIEGSEVVVTRMGKEILRIKRLYKSPRRKGKESMQKESEVFDEGSERDIDFCPGDECSSEEDEEKNRDSEQI